MTQRTAGSPEVERDLDQTRSRLDANLSALQQKLSPGQMMDQGLDFFRSGSGSEFAQNLGRSVRDAPLPVALMGVGLAWLLVSGAGNARRENRGAGPGYDDLASRYGESGGDYGDTGTGVRDRASNLAGGIGDRTRSASDSVRSGVSGTADSLRSGASDTADRVRDLGGSAWDSLQRNPVLAAAFGISAGAVLATLLPASRTEREYLGSAGAAIRDKAMEAGKPLAEKAQRVASEAGGAAKEAAADEGLREQRQGGQADRGEEDHERARQGAAGAATGSEAQRHIGGPAGLAGRSGDERPSASSQHRVEPIAAGMASSSERRG